jgi:hypothetical protein
MRTNLVISLAVALAFGFGPRMALALEDSDKESVRILANDADTDFEAGHYEAAREKFTRAYGIAKVPTLAVRAAQANEKLGRLVAAYELYREALDLQSTELWKGTVQQQAQKEAEGKLEKLQPRIPRLIIILEGANTSDVAVRIDNVQVSSALLGVERFTDPGQHQIVGKRGDEVTNETATLAEGDKKQIVLKFRKPAVPSLTAPAGAPLPPPGNASSQPSDGVPSNPSAETFGPASNTQPPRDQGASSTNTQRTLGWIGVGIGAAGVTLGTVTGIMVASKYSNLSPKCADNNCRGQYTDEVNSYHTMRTLSTVGFVVGGVAAAAGVTLLFTAPKEKAPASVGLWLSPNAAGIKGNF